MLGVVYLHQNLKERKRLSITRGIRESVAAATNLSNVAGRLVRFFARFIQKNANSANASQSTTIQNFSPVRFRSFDDVGDTSGRRRCYIDMEEPTMTTRRWPWLLLLLAAIPLMLFSSCAGFFFQSWPGDEQGSEELLDEVDNLVRALMRKNDVPGLAIGIVHEGETLVLRGYGQADRESNTPVTPDTVFRAYSLAKVFTGLEVVRLADEGIINLDAPLDIVVPEWPGMQYWQTGGTVTIRHLLAHRGGLPRNAPFFPSGPVPIDDALSLQVESMADTWAAHPVGTRYKYSNAGYNVLGRAIEVGRDVSFAVYMSFTALPEYGMVRSAYFTGFLPEDAELATGYVRKGGTFHPVELYDLNWLASGNLFTSAADLAACMSTLLETTPTSSGPLSYVALTSTYVPQYSSPGDPETTGLAWATCEEFAGELMVWHQGGDADANALLTLFPESRTGVCILTNCGSYEGITLSVLVADCLRAVRANPRPVPNTLTSFSGAPAPDQFTGRYVAFGELMIIKESGSRIKADMGLAELRMEPAGESEIGTAYSLSHWLGDVVTDAAFPVDLELVQIIVPPVAAGEHAEHLWLALSDHGYEYCPLYSVPDTVPDSWVSVAGEYDGCEVTIDNDALHMSGIGYLRERGPGYFQVVGGPLDSETVTHDPARGTLTHQGIEYKRL